MEIYVRVHSEDDGSVAWWNANERSSYLMDGKDLWCFNSLYGYGDYCRGTAFSSVKEAKRQARQAVDLAGWDGMVEPKATFWRYVRGKLVQTKFTRDGHLKKIS